MLALGAVSSLATSRAVGVASDLAKAPDDRSRMLPVHPVLGALFPKGGLRRGGTVAVRGSTSLLFAVLARATETGSWAALVGMPDLGLRAASELGVAVERLALVRHPGADLPRVVAALLDGMDLVVVDPGRLTDSQVHRLSARARHRGAVLVSAGPWPGADLELTQEAATWSGLGDGHGRLTTREVRVSVRGRGAATRPAEASLCLPATDSFGALGTDRLSPPEAGAPKDSFSTLPTPRKPAGRLKVLTTTAEAATPTAPRPAASEDPSATPVPEGPSEATLAESSDAPESVLAVSTVPSPRQGDDAEASRVESGDPAFEQADDPLLAGA